MTDLDRLIEAGSDDQVIIRWIGGNCPVQAEGSVGGYEFYFRARGARWSMSIGGEDVVMDPAFYHEEEWGTGPFDAGWMPEDVALQMIGKSAKIFLATLKAYRERMKG